MNKFYPVIVVFSSLLFLNACGGGGSGIPVEEPTVVDPDVDMPILIDGPPAVDPDVDMPILIAEDSCVISGDLKQWHRVALTCEGPIGDESNDYTFTDYKFDVTFTNGNTSITVPGHFAADGNAADTGATSGNLWRAYFSPNETGAWTYTTSFREGENVAIETDQSAGTAVGGIDDSTDTFDVAESDASSPDMRSRGLLQHNSGERYLRFAGDDSVFIQGGMDSPENIFGYDEFDNTTKFSGDNCKGILHSFDAHDDDWSAGDPTWNDEQGKSLIGLVNYISSKGVNSAYIMTNTVNGDGCDAHPWTEYNENGDIKSFDVSKLDQWERALGHMTEKGVMIHAVTQDTENGQLLNNGDLALERKLYYRELISRFAHHPALQWNLGEENTNTVEQQTEFTNFIKDTDPYDHPVFMHTASNEHDKYTDLLDLSSFDGPTFQLDNIPETGDQTVYGITTDWLERSASARNPWVVTMTEASGDNAPTPNSDVSNRQRIYWMWANVMAGGGGFEWYLKNDGEDDAYDLAVEDLREFDQHWEQSGYVVSFFRDVLQRDMSIDLQDLTPDNDAVDGNAWVLSDSDNNYVVFLREGGDATLNLSDTTNYDVLWFNTRTGRTLVGEPININGNQRLGNPPNNVNRDWAVILTPNDIPLTPVLVPAGDFIERDGLVVIEAESTTSNLDLWLEKTDVSGFTGANYLEFDGNTPLNGDPASPLNYTFTVNQGGLYYLHMFVARENTVIGGELRTDVANDGYVRLEGDFGEGPNVGNNHQDDAPLASLRRDTKFFGGNDNRFVWASGARLDLGGERNKRVAIYDLKAGETYTFTLSGRSRFFKVDRFVFRHESVSGGDAQDLSNEETR